jgi:NAD(P)-dependent dehydrogenase (short-subunit alcohol dehydrogenase family)
MNERRVIVTGVGSGIGKATALVLAERGYDIGIKYGTNADGAARGGLSMFLQCMRWSR